MSKREHIDAATLSAKKAAGERIVVVTAYDFPTASCAEGAGVDVVLVGDTAANVVWGQETTLPMTMDLMLAHTEAVARTCDRPMVVGDMPFLSYQTSPADAVANAGAFLRAGAEAVKLEGGMKLAPEIRAVIRAGIPLVGHLGYTPQSVHALGKRRVRGRTLDEARALYHDAKFLDQVGCIALVLECVPRALAKVITESVATPTIGIGSGPDCDGQVLVFHDLVGWTFDRPFHHTKVWADLGSAATEAVRQFADEVRAGSFPGEEHSFGAEYETITPEMLEGDDK